MPGGVGRLPGGRFCPGGVLPGGQIAQVHDDGVPVGASGSGLVVDVQVPTVLKSTDDAADGPLVEPRLAGQGVDAGPGVRAVV